MARVQSGLSAGPQVADRFGRFYAPLAVATAVITFLPIFEDRFEYDRQGRVTFSAHYGTLFDMAGRYFGNAALLALILVGLLVVVLAAASLFTAPAPVAALILVLAGALVTMLLTKPGTGTPGPELSTAGEVGLVIGVFTVVISFAHLVVLHRARRAGA